MNPHLYNSRVRGVPGDYYLHDIQLRREFSLETLHASILMRCDGAHSVEDIAAEFSQPVDDIRAFLSEIESSNLLKMSDEAPEVFAPLTEYPHLREVQLDATGRCNLHGICKHCYGRPVFERAKSKDLMTEELVGFFDQMAALNVGNCFLSGGEIFLRKDLPELVAELRSRHICLDGIFTNGTVHRRDVIEAVLATKVMTAFLVSLDGHTAELNDFMRGPGNFVRTMNFIYGVKDSGLPLTVNTMVTKQTIGFLSEMYTFMKALGVSRWRLSVPREQGETITHKDVIMPEWNDIFDAYENLMCLALDDHRSGGMKIQLSSVFKTEFIKNKVIYLFGGDNSCCEYKRWSLTVKPGGEIVPCTAFDDVSFGNIKTDQLRDVWYSEKTQGFKGLPVGQTKCKDCELVGLCGGGCRKIAHYLHNDVLAIDDHSCPMYRFFSDRILPILEKHGVKVESLPSSREYNFDANLLNQMIART